MKISRLGGETFDVSTWDTSLYASGGTFTDDSFTTNQNAGRGYCGSEDNVYGYCGSEEKWCSYCGRLITEGNTECEGCGAPLLRSVK